MAGGPHHKMCPTLPSRALPTTYDAHTLLTFKPGLKSPGLSGTCMGKPWYRKAQDGVIEMSVRLPLLLCLPFLIEMSVYFSLLLCLPLSLSLSLPYHKHTWDLPGTYQDPARDLPGTYQELVRNLQEPTRDLSGTYQEPTRNLPGTCQEPTRDLPQPYQEPT